MFKSSSKALKEAQQAALNFSRELPPSHLTTIASLSLHGEITSQTYDPVQGLLALGTKSGSIYVFGHPSVALSWLPKLGYPVKFIAWKPSTPYLAVLDQKDSLSIYDMSQLSPVTQEPVRITVLSLRGHSTCIHAPAAHSHIFIGFADGSIDAFDILSGKLSPYRVPNLWLQQEDLMRRSGMLDAPRKGHVSACMDIKTHPRDINLLLIAYEGGVALWSLRDKTAQGYYDMLLPPGAIGGGNEASDGIFEDRRPGVTCIAWRPDGLLFAVGHDDGCIAIWDPQNCDMPVQVRTLERPDVNVLNSEGLFGASETSLGAASTVRQPIFSLAWSGFQDEALLSKVKTSASYYMGSPDPNAIPAAADELVVPGTTILTILGGTVPLDAMGIHCLVFPPFKAPNDVKRNGHQAFRDSVQPIGRQYYPTTTEPQDFLLLARSPHYNLTFDPSAILILQAPDPVFQDSRVQTEQCLSSLQAYRFSFVPNSKPEPLSLPPIFQLYAHGQILQAKCFTCSVTAYQDLIAVRATHSVPYIDLSGGKATSHRPLDYGKANKQQMSRRILVTVHSDLSLQLWDAAALLLDDTGLEELNRGFPEWLFRLDVRRALELQPHLLASQTFRQTPDLLSIQLFDVSLDAGEIVVTLSSGEVLLFRLSVSDALDADMDAPHSPPPGPQFDDTSTVASDSLSHKKTRRFTLRRSSQAPSRNVSQSSPLATQRATNDHLVIEDFAGLPYAQRGLFTFLPVCVIYKVSNCNATSLSLSSVGFLAIGWQDKHLSAIDLRGLDEMLHVRLGDQSSQLHWITSRVGSEHRKALRLVIATTSGVLLTHSFDNSLSHWICTSSGEPITQQRHSLANPLYLSAIDVLGNLLAANGAGLQESLAQQALAGSVKDELHSLLVVVTRSSASVFVNVTEERLAKASFTSEPKAASVVRRYTQLALLVAFADSSFCLYSLPQLGELTRHKPLPSEPPTELISICTDGDLVDLSQQFGLHLKTIWANDRPVFPPSLELWRDTAVEALPASMSLASWMDWLGGKATTPDQLDALLAGPKRQLKFPKTPIKVVEEPVQPLVPEKKRSQRSSSNVFRSQREATQAYSSASQTREALEERSQRIDFLSETMDDISKGASDLVSSAKKLALRESAKNTITSFFK